MKMAALFRTLVSAALSQGLTFALQSYLIFTKQYGSVVVLNKYTGLFALILFLFDGNSGLVYGAMQKRFTREAISDGFALYRTVAYAIATSAMIPYFYFDRATAPVVVPAVIATLGLRFPWIDGFLDTRGRLATAIILSNLWLAGVCLAILLSGRVDASVISIGTVLGSLATFAVRFIYRVEGELRPTVDFRRGFQSGAFAEICRFIGLYGYGQIYGRATVFMVGALFAGPTAALALYGKQIFNVSGMVVSYIRRLEVGRNAHGVGPWRIQEMAFSGGAQLLTAIIGGMLVVASGLTSALVPLALLIVLWQFLEKLSGNCIYAFQLMARHAFGYAGLVFVSVSGGIGLSVAAHFGHIAPYLIGETIAFATVFAVWQQQYLRYVREPSSAAHFSMKAIS